MLPEEKEYDPLGALGIDLGIENIEYLVYHFFAYSFACNTIATHASFPNLKLKTLETRK
ncbi:MAG: hypothetical protein WA667_19195 [Candidatus Nitrosopolaris sp.]